MSHGSITAVYEMGALILCVRALHEPMMEWFVRYVCHVCEVTANETRRQPVAHPFAPISLGLPLYSCPIQHQ